MGLGVWGWAERTLHEALAPQRCSATALGPGAGRLAQTPEVVGAGARGADCCSHRAGQPTVTCSATLPAIGSTIRPRKASLMPLLALTAWMAPVKNSARGGDGWSVGLGMQDGLAWARPGLAKSAGRQRRRRWPAGGM